MKRRLLFIVWLPVLISAAVSISPLLPVTRGIWHLDSQEGFFAALTCFLGLFFSFVYAALSYLLEARTHELTSQLTALSQKLSSTAVVPLNADAFYEHFLAAVRGARSAVRISYFAPNPPLFGAPPARKVYYRRIEREMKTRTEVEFFRLVRESEANLPWIADMVRIFQGKPNVNLASLQGDLDSTKEMPLALSVQVVDNAMGWIVALEAHDRRGSDRDIFADNATLASAFAKYHQRLWGHAKLLLNHGELTEHGSALLAQQEQLPARQ